MMIGPEGYYEVNLKGKTKQEILKKIRSLKREINQLKRSLEEHFLETKEMFPTRLTRLKCYRNYLDRAIQHMKRLAADISLLKQNKKAVILTLR